MSKNKITVLGQISYDLAPDDNQSHNLASNQVSRKGYIGTPGCADSQKGCYPHTN